VVEGVVSKQGTSGIVEKGRISIRKSVISKQARDFGDSGEGSDIDKKVGD
jgi:hypothetical protein